MARYRLNTELIANNWDDMLRVAGSLKLGALSASEFIRTIQSGSRTSTLVRAIAELGRIAKTLFLLAYVDDEAYRRRILVQLNRGEGRHRLARAVFHGQRGELRQRYREGQEDQLGALGLVVNAIILWNTRYMERALRQLQRYGLDIQPEDIERLSPLGFQHINIYLDIFFRDAAHPVEDGWSAGSVGSPRSARSSHRRRLIAVCRSTSRDQPRSMASATNCCSRVSRARNRGAYSLVVKNLEQRR